MTVRNDHTHTHSAGYSEMHSSATMTSKDFPAYLCSAWRTTFRAVVLMLCKVIDRRETKHGWTSY
jgi:hypothetical protein